MRTLERAFGAWSDFGYPRAPFTHRKSVIVLDTCCMKSSLIDGSCGTESANLTASARCDKKPQCVRVVDVRKSDATDGEMWQVYAQITRPECLISCFGGAILHLSSFYL